MDKTTWRIRIEQATQEAGTYQPFFYDIIDTLAGIMENRDKAMEQFKATGGNAVIQHTNQGGNTNLVKNPLLVMANDLDGTALKYWKELGLTSKAFQSMQKNGFKPKETSFEDLLANIGI